MISTFEEWMEKIDRILLRKYTLDSGCMEDFSWRDCYDDGMSTREAIEWAEDYWGVNV
jgi:hypothetical protein